MGTIHTIQKHKCIWTIYYLETNTFWFKVGFYTSFVLVFRDLIGFLRVFRGIGSSTNLFSWSQPVFLFVFNSFLFLFYCICWTYINWRYAPCFSRLYESPSQVSNWKWRHSHLFYCWLLLVQLQHQVSNNLYALFNDLCSITLHSVLDSD